MNPSLPLDTKKPLIIGMVHCLALPNTMNYDGDVDRIIEQAVHDAKTLEKAGVDAIMVENMGDGPLNDKLDIAQIAALSAVTAHVRAAVTIPIGVDAAFNDYEAALSIAKINNASFIRIPVFVDTVVFNGGIVEPCARRAVIYRNQLGAQDIKILADIQVKHSFLLVPEVTIEDSAKNAVASGADMLIVTGTTTGQETPIDLIRRVKKVTDRPIIVGSGINHENIKTQLGIASGAIIGSSLKEHGKLTNPISFDLTKRVIDAFHERK
jgi:uncharacterized protein